MRQKPITVSIARRGFLKSTLAVAGAAVATQALGGQGDTTGSGIAGDTATEPTGYHESDHVKRYYECARI